MNRIRFLVVLISAMAFSASTAWAASPSWQQIAQPAAGWYPYYLQHAAAIYFNDSFWIIGGEVTPAYQPMIRRSPNGTTWEKAVANPPFGSRFGHCLLVFNNKLWLIGGAGSNSFADFQLKNDIWSSTNGTSWTRVVESAPWTPRLDHAAIVFGGKMWIFGGSQAPHQNVSLDDTSVNDIWYSSNGTDWTRATASAAWPARSGHQVVSYNSRLWLIGGSNKNDVWRSDNGTDWTQIASSCAWAGRRGHSVTILNGKMWIVGGAFYKFETSQGSSPEPYYTTYNDVYSSTDGAAWNKEASGALLNPSGSWSNRYNCASCMAGSTFWAFPGPSQYGMPKTTRTWKTSDGVSWTYVLWDFKTPLGVLNTVCVHNSKIWLFTHEIGEAILPPTAFSTTDAGHWTVQARDADSYDPLTHDYPFSFNGKLWQINRGTGLQNSTDATTWTAVSELPEMGFVIPHQNQLWFVHQVMGLIGPIQTLIWISTDSGKTWTPKLERAHSLLLSTLMVSFNGRMYSFGATVISSSTDAVNWPIAVNPTPWTGTAAATVHRSRLWVLSGAGELWSSPNGATWTKESGPAPWFKTNLPTIRLLSLNGSLYYLSNQKYDYVYNVSYPAVGEAWRFDMKNSAWSKAWLNCR